MHDRQEVFGELALGSESLVVENHELDLLSLEKPLNELESEAAESVAMGNGNRSYSSLQRAFQNGFKTLALEVEPAADVFDNFGFGAPLPHVRDLAFEVGFLAGGGDSAVGDCDARVGDGLRSGLGTRVMGVGRGEEGVDIVKAGTPGRSQCLNLPGGVPKAERSNRHAETLRRSPAFRPHHKRCTQAASGGIVRFCGSVRVSGSVRFYYISLKTDTFWAAAASASSFWTIFKRPKCTRLDACHKRERCASPRGSISTQGAKNSLRN